MQVIGSDQQLAAGAGTAVTIGAYDGVHLGHRHLLAVLRQRAQEHGLKSAVVTFDRHPATIVRPSSAPLLLTDLEQKLELLADCGVDVTLVVPFDEVRAKESAEDFVHEVLLGALDARRVVVGEDFHFGRERRGNVALLRRLGAAEGFEVEGVALADDGGEAVSSTRIRRLVADGDVAGAAPLLGRPHQVRGTVVRGDGRGGSLLGFPTANVAVPTDIAVPGVGIYAGRYEGPDRAVHVAAIAVGRRPTFFDPHAQLPTPPPPPLVEAHLLDFDANLYGEPARVSFVQRLRDEQRFDTVEELVAQMHRDVDATRRLLTSANG